MNNFNKLSHITSTYRKSIAWNLDPGLIHTIHDPLQNDLLATLPSYEFRRLLPYLELIHMPRGDISNKLDGDVKYVYFPTTAIISLNYILSNGSTAQTAIVGYEGVVGVSLLMGCKTISNLAIVQSAGFGYRLKAALLINEFECGGIIFGVFLRYYQALMTHITQTAACNRHHNIEQQFCRFLLLYLDRLPSNSLAMTHELIANLLGVRREGITEAAGNLQRKGLIKCNRGFIEVIARQKLEICACECYAVVKSVFDQLQDLTPISTDFFTAFSRICCACSKFTCIVILRDRFAHLKGTIPFNK